jgi:hypothetical protein
MGMRSFEDVAIVSMRLMPSMGMEHWRLNERQEQASGHDEMEDPLHQF